MKIPFKMSILGVVLAAVAGSATAQAIPRSGSFTLHMAYKGSGDVHQVTDSRRYWFGTWLGISYNSAGSGLFHAGPVLCGGYLELVNGASPSKGVCTFGDGGDKVHGEWHQPRQQASSRWGTARLAVAGLRPAPRWSCATPRADSR